MAIAAVAIIGRPNVGKSSLFNRLTGKRISIVDPMPGVTRDRVTAVVQHDEKYFELADTGGYGVDNSELLKDQIYQQILFAVQQADLVILLVDIRAGLMPLDRQISDMLRKEQKPVILAANKADRYEDQHLGNEFLSLGWGQPICISTIHARGLDDLRDAIAANLDDQQAQPTAPIMKIAIVGRRNVGKSTFINTLAGQERVIVSEVPGTTRDAVDVQFEHDGSTFMAIDTAGVRKKSKLANNVEYYGLLRVENSIIRADVVLLMIDATEPIGQLDKKLGAFITQHYKPCIVVVNKWDLIGDQADTSDYGQYIEKIMPAMSNAPVASTAARDGLNVWPTIRLARTLFAQACTRVPTGQLNRAMEQIQQKNPATAVKGAKPLKIFYTTQIDTSPPTIVIFVNNPDLIGRSYQRYLLNQFHRLLPFHEVPIRLMFRARRPTREADMPDK